MFLVAHRGGLPDIPTDVPVGRRTYTEDLTPSKQDALAAAWNLTALAAAAIRRVAEATDRDPVEVLHQLEAEGCDGLVRTGKPAKMARPDP